MALFALSVISRVCRSKVAGSRPCGLELLCVLAFSSSCASFYAFSAIWLFLLIHLEMLLNLEFFLPNSRLINH